MIRRARLEMLRKPGSAGRYRSAAGSAAAAVLLAATGTACRDAKPSLNTASAPRAALRAAEARDEARPASELHTSTELPSPLAHPGDVEGAAPGGDASASEREERAPRVYAKARFIWIRPKPDVASDWIGFMWTGGSVRLRSETPVPGPGCRTWYAIEPSGFVCVDGSRATLDANDPILKALRPYAPKLDSPWPHQYAESQGTALSMLLPGAPLDVSTLPITIHEPRHRLKPRSTVAYSTEVHANGQDFLLSADYQWLPKAKVTPYPVVQFHGVKLGSDAALPLAFFRKADSARYRRGEHGFEATPDSFPRLGFVELGPDSESVDGERYLKTRDGASWVRASDAVLPVPRDKTPWGAEVGAPDTTGRAPEGRATWLEVSVMGGFLIAYEGTRPVFVTLISPGRGGYARPGEDAVAHAATPLGTFPISGKLRTATMEAPGEYIHSDVPWTQNFSGPHALHGAYWHDDFGNRKSGGCVNVSPIDGRYLFEFTDPPVPPGWHAVRWLPWKGPATLLVIHP